MYQTIAYSDHCILFIQLQSYIIYIIITIGVFNKDTLFCSSDNLLESLEHETLFCTLSGKLQLLLCLSGGMFISCVRVGFVRSYGLGQISLWIVFHAIGLLKSICFPFFYRKIKQEGALKYIHISTVIVALVLPLVLALLHLIDGYSVAPSPVVICTSQNITITYYSLVLPVSVLFGATTTILILLFRKIFRVPHPLCMYMVATLLL